MLKVSSFVLYDVFVTCAGVDVFVTCAGVDVFLTCERLGLRVHSYP